MTTTPPTTRDFYKVLIVGQSGKGKTYSARNLDRDTTGFINVEKKPLPFKGAFKHTVVPNNADDVLAALADFSKNPDVKAIFVDSFSAFADMLLAEARKTKKGFDIWSAYAEGIGRFLEYVKRVKKEVFLTAHYEILNVEGAPEKRTKVKGKEWEGLIEKEFAIVLYADSIPAQGDGKYRRPDYILWLAKDDTSAKCPPDIFGEDVVTIPNDLDLVLGKVYEFVGAQKEKKAA